MIKKTFSTTTVVMVAVFFFVLGLVFNKGLGSAALSIPLLSQTNYSTHTCVDQKCIAVTSQCSTDSNCETHLQCNSSKQCVSTSGTGKNTCSVNDDCSPTTNADQWCKSHNPGTNLISKAIKYPNGKFTCDCYYNAGGIISQTQCTNYHLNQ